MHIVQPRSFLEFIGGVLLLVAAVRVKAGESPLDQGGRKAPHPHPEATAPGTEKPRWSAARRASCAQDAHAREAWTAMGASRRSIPSPFAAGEQEGARFARAEIRRTRRRKEYGR